MYLGFGICIYTNSPRALDTVDADCKLKTHACTCNGMFYWGVNTYIHVYRFVKAI